MYRILQARTISLEALFEMYLYLYIYIFCVFEWKLVKSAKVQNEKRSLATFIHTMPTTLHVRLPFTQDPCINLCDRT